MSARSAPLAKSARNPKRRTVPRSRRTARLQEKHLILLDRHSVAWQHPATGDWRSSRTCADVMVMAGAPAHFHVNAVLERDSPFVWIGIDPDPKNPRAPRTCYAVIGGDALRSFATEVLRYSAATKGGAR